MAEHDGSLRAGARTGANAQTKSDGQTESSGRTKSDGQTESSGRTRSDGQTESSGRTRSDGRTESRTRTQSGASNVPATSSRGDSALVVVCGLPGVGKTTVARTITERTDGALFRTDVVRKELFPEPEYTDDETNVVYETLFQRAHDTVESGTTAVLDGTFTDRTRRNQALAVAEELDVGWTVVNVECAEDIVERRIRQRENDESDADFEIYLMYRDAFDPFEVDHVTVDNSDGLTETIGQIERYF